eukprot:1567722-Rhodomonas_salina.4
MRRTIGEKEGIGCRWQGTKCMHRTIGGLPVLCALPEPEALRSGCTRQSRCVQSLCLVAACVASVPHGSAACAMAGREQLTSVIVEGFAFNQLQGKEIGVGVEQYQR